MRMRCAHTDDRAIALACSGVRTVSVAQPARRNSRANLTRRNFCLPLLYQLHSGFVIAGGAARQHQRGEGNQHAAEVCDGHDELISMVLIY